MRKHITIYLTLGLTLSVLALLFLNFSVYRLPIAILIGFSYFIWGLYVHFKDKTLHLSIVLEYLAISLLATILLIFISLRA